MNRILFGLLTIALAVFSTLSCSDKTVTDPSAIALNDSTSDASLIASAAIRLTRDTIAVGDTARAIVTLRDSQNRPLYQRITWGSSDSSVATVSPSGLVRAISPGRAAIIATRGWRSARAMLTVIAPSAPAPAPVASVSISPPSSTVQIGGTVQLSATTLDASGNALTGRAVTWSSADAAIATVSASGLVSGIGAGSVQITASSEGKTAGAAIVVSTAPPVPIASISVTPAAATLAVGATVQLSVTARDANDNVLTGRVVTSSSADPAIASVNSMGLVTAVSVGTTQITVVSEGKSAIATITVTAPPPVPVASITVSPATSSLQVGAAVQLAATTRDASGNVLTGRAVTWTSGNPALASVSSSGRATAVAAGTTQIVATSEGKSGSAALTITAATPAPVASISVVLGSGSLTPGSTTQATATTRDASNNLLTGRAIAWSSSNNAVATVSATGLVTAVAVGTAQITAGSEGRNGSASLVVQVAGSSNEPSGMTLVSDRPFNALHELGWDEPSNGQPTTNVAIMADATAPKSPVNIMRITYPAGFGGGSAPWDADSPNFLYKTVYVSHWSRVSSNWEGHPGSSINKQYYLYTSTDVPSIVVVLHGSGTGSLQPFIEGQNIVAGGQGSADPQNPDWGPNLVPSAQVTRGAWFHIEVVAAMNTAGNADGYLDLWLDGVHVTHVAGIKFQNSPPSWRSLHLAPVWGGGGGTVKNTMTMDFDNLYFSGKN